MRKNRKFVEIEADENYIHGLIAGAINDLRIQNKHTYHNASIIREYIDKYKHTKFDNKQAYKKFKEIYKEECKRYEKFSGGNFGFRPRNISPVLILKMVLGNIFH